MNSNTLGRCLALVLVFVTGNGAAADVPLIVPLSGRVLDGPVMQGYSFSVNQALTVTGLGKVDANDNGILDDLNAPQIGLWNADTSELITSAFIGTDMFFQDQMFVAPIAPIRLPAGRYTVAAQFFNDQEPFLALPEYETPFVMLHDIIPTRNLGDTFVLPTGRARMALGPNLLIEQPKVLLTEPRRLLSGSTAKRQQRFDSCRGHFRCVARVVDRSAGDLDRRRPADGDALASGRIERFPLRGRGLGAVSRMVRHRSTEPS